VSPITLTDVLTVAAAAAHVGKSATTVQRAIQRGELPAKRLGHQLFVKVADVDRWAAARWNGRP
jgi:excisionase family DNA binding protein